MVSGSISPATGTTPPRMPMVEGGRKIVVCSWRGAMGIGARIVHEACEDGWESAKEMEFAMSRRVVEETMVIFVEMLYWNKLKYIYSTRSNHIRTTHLGFSLVDPPDDLSKPQS
jgi:hypothetical protein